MGHAARKSDARMRRWMTVLAMAEASIFARMSTCPVVEAVGHCAYQLFDRDAWETALGECTAER
jgi:hypothetical protein